MLKKLILLLLIISIFCSFTSCKKKSEVEEEKVDISEVSTTESGKSSSSSESEIALNKEPSQDLTGIDLSVTSTSKKHIEKYVKNLINESYDGTKLESLTVMSDNNSSNSEDYKVYTIISWSKEATPTDSKSILEDYSNNISSMINANLENVTELSLIWRVPYINGNATAKYKKIDGFLSLYDISFNKKFGDSAGTTEADTETDEAKGAEQAKGQASTESNTDSNKSQQEGEV